MARSNWSLWRRVWSFFDSRNAADAQVRRRPPLGVEGLEDRWVPASQEGSVVITGPSTAVRTLDQTFVFSTSTEQNATYTINWGDGTAKDTITGSSVSKAHAYAKDGSYTITASATGFTSATQGESVSPAGFLTDPNIDANTLYVVPVANGATLELSAGSNTGDVSVSLTEGSGSPFQQSYSGSDAVIVEPGGGKADKFQVDTGISQTITVEQGTGSGSNSLTINNASGPDATLTTGIAALSGSSITFDSSVSSLTVTGNATVGDGTDAVTGPAVLTVDGTTQIDTSSVSTTGTQTYGGAVTLAQASTLSASAVTFSNTVDGAQSLSISGNATFDGDLGDTNNLSSLSISGASTIGASASSITTTGAQSYGGAVTLATGTTLTAAGGVTFSSTVDGGHSLSLNGAVTFDGNVGATTTKLTSLTVNGASTIGASATSLRTTGTQYYGGAVMLGVDPAFTASTVTFNDRVDGAESVAITGAAVFKGEVGANNQLTSLSVSGASTINTDALDTSTSGAQSYGGAVTLATGTTLTASTVTFENEVDGAFSLTISNAATFDGNVGSDAVLASLTVNGASTIGASATSLKTTGTQYYGGTVLLSTGDADPAFTANTVTFNNTVDGAEALSITGAAVFNGEVGTGTQLTSLSVSGASTINTDMVTTSGKQSYGGAVTLTASSNLTASAVTFKGTVDGAQSLTITGAATFDGDLGDTNNLSSLSISGASTIGASASSITTTGAAELPEGRSRWPPASTR